jgi:hypothetical protein
LWEGIQNCLNERQHSTPKGDDNKSSENTLVIFKNLLQHHCNFYQTGYKSPLSVGKIQVCSNKGSGPLQWVDNYQNAKIGKAQVFLKFFKNCCTRNVQIYMAAF